MNFGQIIINRKLNRRRAGTCSVELEVLIDRRRTKTKTEEEGHWSEVNNQKAAKYLLSGPTCDRPQGKASLISTV